MAAWQRYVALGLEVLGVLLPRDALARAGSALVLEKSGGSEPELQPYTEIPAGVTVSLAPGSRLVILHYAACRVVTVVGGKIAVAAHTYTITGGAKPQEVPTPCPQTARLKDEGEMAGIMFRSIPSTLNLSTTPTFVLVGSRADEFASIRISRGDTTLLEAPLAGRSFRWPAGVKPLTPNDDYDMALVPKAPGKARMVTKFWVEARDPARSSEQVTLIQVEEEE